MIEEGGANISGKVVALFLAVAGSLLTLGIAALFGLWANVIGMNKEMFTKDESVQLTREIESELRAEMNAAHARMNGEINRLRRRHEP